MKKAIKRFWGIGLIVIILSSLFVAPASVSAADNEFTVFSTPGGAPTYALAAGDVRDFAVFGTGSTIYAVIGDSYVYKSTNGGMTWARTTTAALAINPIMIAVAPDNADRIAITDAAGAVYASVNGGVVFSDLGAVTDGANPLVAPFGDLTISATRLGANYVTVCGTSTGVGTVYYYNMGAVVGQQWTRLAVTTADNIIGAVGYSPNFASDLTMLAVSVDTAADNAKLQVYRFGSGWNPLDFPGYPVTVATDITTSLTTLVKASLAFDPAYLGGEDSPVFIGLDTDVAAIDGVYRVANTNVRFVTAGGIYSVAYDGTTLVAGQTATTTILRSTDPLTSAPTVSSSSALKSPGGLAGAGNNVVVAFVGTNIAAGTSGANSAFALSRNGGAGFNDVSLIDTTITDANDVAVSSDSSKMYWVTDDGAYVSLWYRATGWERVLTFASASDFIVRLSPADPNVVYLAEKAGTRVYFSKDVQTRWFARTATDQGAAFTAIQDFAVESNTVVYAMDAAGNVIKSTNEGFIWSVSPTANKLNNGYSLTSVKENVILAGGTGGRVAYSLDGGTTWTAIGPGIATAGATNVIVIADENFATNNIIYAATNAVNLDIVQWTIGTSTTWTDIYSGPATTGTNVGVYGLAMKGGVLYALTVDTVAVTSTLEQYIPAVRNWAKKVADTYIVGPVTELVQLGIGSPSPNALVASTGSNKLWAVKTNLTAQKLYTFVDSLASSVPSITGPVNGVSVTASTGVPDVVILTWGRVGNATTHTYQVAYDQAFTQPLNGSGTGVNFPTLNAVIGGPGGFLSAGHTYYWRVRASAPVNSPWSETRTIVVQALAAAVPAISSPVNGSTIQNQSPAFSWTPVTSTTKYEFQLSTTPTFGTTVLTDTPSTAGALVPVTIKLEQGKQYFWRVRALEPVQGDWSTVANFVVAMPATTAPPAVTITQVPAPIITIPPAPAAPTYTLVPPAEEVIAPTYIWAIIIIGAILVIAVIVLIVRTRRSV